MSLDPRTKINLPAAITEAAGFEITFGHFEDDETTPETLSGTWQLDVSTDEAGKSVIASFKEDSGFTLDENTLTWKRTAAQNLLKAGKYFFFINQTINGDRLLIYYGNVSVNPNTNPS